VRAFDQLDNTRAYEVRRQRTMTGSARQLFWIRPFGAVKSDNWEIKPMRLTRRALAVPILSQTNVPPHKISIAAHLLSIDRQIRGRS
jgi:hypothetical protein